MSLECGLIFYKEGIQLNLDDHERFNATQIWQSKLSEMLNIIEKGIKYFELYPSIHFISLYIHSSPSHFFKGTNETKAKVKLVANSKIILQIVYNSVINDTTEKGY